MWNYTTMIESSDDGGTFREDGGLLPWLRRHIYRRDHYTLRILPLLQGRVDE